MRQVVDRMALRRDVTLPSCVDLAPERASLSRCHPARYVASMQQWCRTRATALALAARRATELADLGIRHAEQ